jgi:hypothetical protein
MSRVRTWAETVRRAEALEDILVILAHYLPENSGVRSKDALREIIRAVKMRVGHPHLKIQPPQNFIAAE